jgi:biofilm PGA synthesis lipoprotein PgaB
MAKSKWYRQSRRSMVRGLLLIGSGAFLLGAGVPLAGALSNGSLATPLGQPRAIKPLLLAYEGSPTVEAFPTRVSSELICRPRPRADWNGSFKAMPGALNANSLPIQGGVSRVVSSALRPDLLHTFNAAPWPHVHSKASLAKVPILMYHDVLTEPEVFFDLLPEQFEDHLKLLRGNGFTVVSLDQVVRHLRTGIPLPEKPVLLTFDDGYAGHFEHVYPLLKQYQAPAVFSVFPGKLDGDVAGRSTLTWEQLKIMAADPLITVASHSVTHPPDLTQMTDQDLLYEVTESKRRLEEELGIPIQYFTYPAGHYDERVAQAVANAGYMAALTMRLENEQFAGASESLLAIERFGQSNLESLLEVAWGGPPAPGMSANRFDFSSPVGITELTLEDVPISLISGGRPVTIHADSRYQVQEILAGTNAIAGVDGGFFSLEYLNSNVMIGPVLSQSSRLFVPGNASENPRLNGRPLVLISPQEVKFIPFQSDLHNTLAGVQRHLPEVTDAFVAAAWLVKGGVPQPASSFGTLFDFDAYRHRAFWGINHAGQPVVGVSHDLVDSVTLGNILAQAGLRDAVMVDSGASTSLAYQGESLVGYIPRPVPHVVALIPPHQDSGTPCPLVIPDQSDE